MNRIACTWTRAGEANVDRPIASCNEKPTAMIAAMMIALRTKKRSSAVAAGSDGCANGAMCVPPPPPRLLSHVNAP